MTTTEQLALPSTAVTAPHACDRCRQPTANPRIIELREGVYGCGGKLCCDDCADVLLSRGQSGFYWSPETGKCTPYHRRAIDGGRVYEE